MEEIDEILVVAEDAAESAAAGEISLGTQVEASTEVEAMADAPLKGDGVEDIDQLAEQQAAEGRPWVQKMKDFAVWAGKNAAGAGVGFGVMYGLNKAFAQKAHDSGQRVALSDYLTKVQATFEAKGLSWDHDHSQKAADDALSYPWIDCTA